MNIRQLPAVAALAALLPAQAWVGVDSSPARIDPVVFDAAHQRAVGFTAGLARTWSFAGVGWRPHLPDGLEGRAARLVAYDPSRGQIVAVMEGGAGLGWPRTYVSDGAGWVWMPQAGSPPAVAASAAFDQNSNRVIAFGGLDQLPLQNPTDAMHAWNGTAWVVLNPALRPPPRSQAALALDPVRGRVVLFGGQGFGGYFNDTWEWDGGQWLQQQPAVSPSPRGSRLAFDPATQEVVLLGGGLSLPFGDCWGWDGTQWAARGTLPAGDRAPGWSDGNHLHVVTGSDRANVWRANGASWVPVWTDGKMPLQADPAAAYDQVRGEILITAGIGAGGTWVWNGGWQQRSALSPGARLYSAMAPRGTTMVLFGGMLPPLQAVADTWIWNGVTWTLQFPAQQPPPRYGHAMAGLGTRVLLFGGTGSFGPVDDTWQFDGVAWTQLQPLASPVARHDHGLCFDPLRQRTVLYGGQNWSAQLRDTWEWDGTNWQQKAPTQLPQDWTASLAFDAARGAVVLAQRDQVWAWDGTNWNPDAIATGPYIANGVLAFHEARQRLVHYGGDGVTSVYGPTPSDAAAGWSCGNRPDLRAFGRPAVGATCHVHVEGAQNALAIVAYSLQPGLVQWFGCDQQIGAIGATFAGLLDARGELSVPLVLPAVPGYRGVEIHAQAVVLDGGPVFGASLTGGLRLLVGD